MAQISLGANQQRLASCWLMLGRSIASEYEHGGARPIPAAALVLLSKKALLQRCAFGPPSRSRIYSYQLPP